MAYQHWSYDTLHRLCMEAFQKFGFTEAEADIIQDVLLTADLYGIESHGMQRMVRYHKCIEKGMIDVHAKPEVVFETPISAVIDAHEAMGQLVSHKAMKMAIEKAKTTGVGIVSVRNSNHYGIAGYYAKMACKEGLMGFSCTNSEAIMVPTFARKAMLGSNPIACAFPAEPYDFFFDASTTVVTRGKLEMDNKMEKPLPEGWALDKDGHPSTNAPDVLANIVADVIKALASTVRPLVKEGGIFLCSGIIDDRAEEVAQCLRDNGWTIAETRSSEGWFSYLCR